MKRPTLKQILGVSALFLSSFMNAKADVYIFDADCIPSEWQAYFRNGNPPPTSPPQVLRKPGGRTNYMWETSAIGPSDFHYDAQIVFIGKPFNPATDGRMGRIDYVIWNQAPSSAYAATTKPLFKQGDSFYTISSGYEPHVYNSSWKQVPFGFHSSALYKFIGTGPSQPDSSPTGAPIYVGYFFSVGFNGHSPIMYHRACDLEVRIQSVQNVSGRITLEGSVNLAQTVQMTFRTSNGTSFDRSVPLAADGSFTVTDIPRDIYTLHVQGAKWLGKNQSNVDCRNSDVSGVNLTLQGGDANGDNAVDILDLLSVIAHYNKVAPDTDYLAAADFNSDGSNDILDLNILIGNYNQLGED